ncbi:MAG: hypothetical protein CVV64_10405 [Candidatus Wallbacteria bacterium HGW-Wallbacteria-1]|jgi:anti-anti-sigma factor|uniref:Anti-sigma factor antagonist n=1 Tax=Candidatus Wallbacteria bacterium HGW-Wallbacteria-1 TaxID=2013854 RepID=A0A2N1PPC0_9BACT|nr:MAG: hypothetical protein CVV64_10405 [Candidatus Wallbacteria bacterium HGW-Wallbacteria-1]
MALSYRLEEGIVIICVDGNMDQFTAQQLDLRLSQITDKMNPVKIILDLSSCPYMGSSLIGKFAQFYRDIAAKSGCVVFCSLRPFVKNLFTVTKLDEYFDVTADLPSAKRLIQGKFPGVF